MDASNHDHGLPEVMAGRYARRQLGLEKLMANIERPYADEFAMADVEGRARPLISFGGIDRQTTEFWYTTSQQAALA